MSHDKFFEAYKSIIRKSVSRLKVGGFAVIVIGEVRDKDGYYVDFNGMTKNALRDAGAKFYNDAVLLNNIGSASMRTKQFEISKKLVKTHQNVLIFKKTQ